MTIVTVSNIVSVENDEVEDSGVTDAVTEEEDTVNPIEMIAEDDCQEEDSIQNSHPNNNLCFIEDDVIESINNMNNATRHRSNYNNMWDEIKSLDIVEYVSGINHTDGPIIWKVISSCDDDSFEETCKEELKSIIDIVPLESESEDEDGRGNVDDSDDYEKAN